MDEQIRNLQEYVYARHIEGMRIEGVDEEEAVRVLEAYFSRPENSNDSECVYLGILYFELGWGKEGDEQIDYFRRAKRWLDLHRSITGEEWDAVDDRLTDLADFFESQGIELEAAEAPEPLEAAMAPVMTQEIQDHGAMMLIPAGAFLYGRDQERVNLPAFYIDKFPVTNRQYEAFCRATGYRFPKHWQNDRFNSPDAPVVGVSVNDALKYSRWVGKQLPTEQQWEKACRGVDGRAYPWGDADVTDDRACFGQDPAEGSTCPVMAHAEGASPYGVADLVGNTWEWTSTTDLDPETVHIIKGGCYNDPPELLHVDIRLAAVPKDKFETIGFRCVKSA